MDRDPSALAGGNLAGAVVRVGVHDQELVHQWVALHQVPSSPADDGPDRLGLVERRQHQADGQPGLLLEVDQPVEVGELAMMEVRLAEPALDSERYSARIVGRLFGRGQRLLPLGKLIERGLADRLARLDDDHRLARAGRDRLRQRAEEERRTVVARREGRCAHHDHVRQVGLVKDGIAHIRRLEDGLLHVAVGVLANEMGQRFGCLRADGRAQARGHDVQGDDVSAAAAGQGVGELEGQLGVGAAADRHENPPDLHWRALLDDGDVARRVSNDLVDRGAEDGRFGAGPGRGGLAAPAEDDQLRVELGRGLDHAFRGAPPDADDGVDRHSLGRVVEDSLQQPAGLAGLGGTLAERRSLGHLDDPEHGQAAVLAVEQGRSDADQLLGRQRVGDGDQDSSGQRRARHSAARCRAVPPACRTVTPAFAASVQCATRYGLSSSNSRAWRSTSSSACSPERRRLSITKRPTRPK